MSGFKGTKGPWYMVTGNVSHIGECLSIASTTESSIQRPLICVVSNITSFTDSDKDNAILISKAPEMLEMLEKVKGAVLIAQDMGLYREIENLIKQATKP